MPSLFKTKGKELPMPQNKTSSHTHKHTHTTPMCVLLISNTPDCLLLGPNAAETGRKKED